MMAIVTTCLIYILLFIEYMLLYPNTQNWLGNTVCILLILGLIIFNVLYQSVWVASPKIKGKKIVTAILFANFISMILVFMVEAIWNLILNRIYIMAFIIMMMILHLILIAIQNYYLYAHGIFWKQEYQFLKSKTEILNESDYEKYLKKYLRFVSCFSVIYFINDNQWLDFVLITSHIVYAIYLYETSWKKGYMDEIIYDNEKKYYHITLIVTSITVIVFHNYIPNVLGMIIVTLPDLILRLYLQRYIHTLIQRG